MATIQQMIRDRMAKTEPKFVVKNEPSMVKLKVDANPKILPKIKVGKEDNSKVKINVTTADKIKAPVSKPPANILPKMRISAYGPTGNPMASGKMPYEGAVATSWVRDPKTGKPIDDVPLGTKVKIDGKTYTVEDRTADWINPKRGKTLDIFYNTTSQPFLLGKGEPKKDVEIINK
jgi:hypothetical protein